MNEIFGQGAASYIEVRDEFAYDELVAWAAFFERWDKEQDLREKEKEHQDVMAAARRALH